MLYEKKMTKALVNNDSTTNTQTQHKTEKLVVYIHPPGGSSRNHRNEIDMTPTQMPPYLLIERLTVRFCYLDFNFEIFVKYLVAVSLNNVEGNIVTKRARRSQFILEKMLSSETY